MVGEDIGGEIVEELDMIVVDIGGELLDLDMIVVGLGGELVDFDVIEVEMGEEGELRVKSGCGSLG